METLLNHYKIQTAEYTVSFFKYRPYYFFAGHAESFFPEPVLKFPDQKIQQPSKREQRQLSDGYICPNTQC